MKKIRLDCGFTCEVDENLLDNMELVDALAEGRDGDALFISRICSLVFDKQTKKALYDHLRSEDGRVPVEDVNSAVIDLFNKLGTEGKNS